MTEQLNLLQSTHARASDFTVRESKRAKTMSIRVDPIRGVEVVTPPHTKPKVVQAFVEEQRDWIKRTVFKIGVNVQDTSLELPLMINLPALGLQWSVNYDQQPTPSVKISEEKEWLVVRGRCDAPWQTAHAFKPWLAQKARPLFRKNLDEISAETGLKYKSLQVRGQRTRWGSFSTSGTVSLNYCLLFLPTELMRYVLLHELCHSLHANHSKRYWALVGSHESNYKQLEASVDEGWKQVPLWLLQIL